MALSRTLIVLVAGLAAPALADEATVTARYREVTSVEPRCQAPRGDAIVVCGRRAADRWRVPLIGYDAGDPRGESVEGERKRLAAAPSVPCGIGAFLANCGMVGVSAAVGLGPGAGNVHWRPLAH